ncbi:28S ribosomal protein S36, mitochondrial isoform X4 [Gymnodraco acuticeps]|uniref:28S ribosomal protein S36, mitochondrial isoform X4 n=1 Tax=Gymnodraco acuticeps TaxID=8218 RepID=A0A6P8W4K7_GYMAC|nr:28S ribosomal protein S36, mitochondrial isoform X4 [Gymnodraco acuticeps]
MGSKVSSKMAAPAARVIQAIRPHAPLIKFPNRQEFPRPNGSSAASNTKTSCTFDPDLWHGGHPGLHSASPCEVPQETHDSGGNGLHPAWGTRVT